MQNETPLVSIIILTMNHEKFIEQACESALAQNYPNIEIILLDNLSDDKTFQLAKESLANANIKTEAYQNTERFGVAKNLNFLLSKTSGKHVGILSGDDWWDENMVAEKVKFVEETNCDFALSDGYKFIQETNETIPAYSGKDKEKVQAMLPHFFRENVTENRTVNVGTFVKKEILESHLFDENIQTEDWDMNLRLTHLGYQLGFLDQKLFYYRVLANSLSRNWKVMSDSYKKVTDKYLDFIHADSVLEKDYQLHLLQFKFEILLSETLDNQQRKALQKEWKKEKYKLKYTQPQLFFKLFFLKFR
jgi:glycosyltransferase involved in cell wall biosynthesis